MVLSNRSYFFLKPHPLSRYPSKTAALLSPSHPAPARFLFLPNRSGVLLLGGLFGGLRWISLGQAGAFRSSRRHRALRKGRQTLRTDPVLDRNYGAPDDGLGWRSQDENHLADGNSQKAQRHQGYTHFHVRFRLHYVFLAHPNSLKRPHILWKARFPEVGLLVYDLHPIHWLGSSVGRAED